jgi:hypothetical protein
MIRLNRMCYSLIVTASIASLIGCGSSNANNGNRTTLDFPSSEKASREPGYSAISSDEIVTSVSQIELQAPASALEIANPPTKAFLRDDESGALKVSFADLNLKSVLNIESVTRDDVNRFPDWLKSLNGTKIRIRGYMYPTYEETGIETFVLDHSPRITNFGTDPKVYELLQVKLAAGTTTDYVGGARPTEVIGLFRIELCIEDGKIYGLYFLDDAVVVAINPLPRQPQRN